MNADHENLKKILAEAAALATPEDRTRYLDGACGDDAGLRAQVERLLLAHERAGDFLEDTGPGPECLQEGPGTVIGRYKLLEEIGEGAFGRVFMAEQVEPVRRKVALKLIKPGMDSREVVARFEAERQALALMDHPNIAHVYDAGTTETGRPYFVMELVRGLPLTRYCDEHDLPMGERLRLFTEVCHAVQHAHQKGVIHRDLKPTNILVTELDGKPAPKVIDFGVAKALGQQLTDKTLFTAFQQLIGTPAYMSPEQTALSGADVDTRSDVYSLGVLLYELLTGVTPLDTRTLYQAGLEEMRRMIRETEPPKPSTKLRSLGVQLTVVARHRHAEPSTLTRVVTGDLDWIVMKALEKDRARRYQTITALADDIDRHLASEPVSAGPPGMLYRTRKFVRRHKTGAAIGIAAVVAVLLSVAALAWGLVQTRQQRDRAVVAEARAGAEAQRAEQQAAISEAVNEFLLDDLLGQASPEEEPDRDIKLRTLVDRASENAGGRFSEQPLVELKVRETLFEVYLGLGEFEKARAELEREKEICRQMQFTGEDRQWLGARFDEARLLGNEGQPAEAQVIYEEIVPIWRRVLGEEHPDTLNTMHNLAAMLQDQGKTAEAQAIYEELVPIRIRVLGKEHPDTLKTMHNLANALLAQGKTAEAQAIYEEVLSIRRRVQGKEHPDTLKAMSNLAAILSNLGKAVEAQAIQEEVLAIRRRVLGEEHPDTLSSMSNLAIALGQQGKSVEAQAMFEELLKIRRKRLEMEHPDTLRTKQNLALLYCDCLGKPAKAQAMFEELLEIQWRVLKPEHPDTLKTRLNLAHSLEKQDKHVEAQAMFEELLKIQRRVLKPEHPETLSSMNGLAVVLGQQGKSVEAQAMFEELLKIRRKRLEMEHPDTLRTMHNLSVILRKQGKVEEARKVWKELLEIQRKVLGLEHPDTLRTKSNLAGLEGDE